MPRIYGVGDYQTPAQRLSRLEALAEAERSKLQARFRQQANLAARDMGRAQGLADRFSPPAVPSAISEIPTALGPGFRQADPEFLKYREKARRFGIDLGEIQEPSTYLGGEGIQPAPAQRHIFGQESQAFAEQVAPREHQRRLISEADVQGLGLPGRIAREASYVDPATIMLAPLVGPNVFGRGALEAAPTLKQLAGVGLSAVGADLPVAVGQLGRAGLRAGARALASEAGGVAVENAPRRAALFKESRALELRAQELTTERLGWGKSLDEGVRSDPEIKGLVDRAEQIRNEIADLSTERGGIRIRKPAPEPLPSEGGAVPPGREAGQQRGRLSGMRQLRDLGLTADDARRVVRGEIDSFEAAQRLMSQKGVRFDKAGNASLVGVDSRQFIADVRGTGLIPSEGHQAAIDDAFGILQGRVEDAVPPTIATRARVNMLFPEGGAVPPGRPPSGPALPPEPPVEPPSWEAAVEKLNQGLRTSGRRLAKTEIERSADRGRRIAEYQNIIRTERAAGRPTSEAFQRANAALTGEYAKFKAPEFGLSEAESEAIWARAADFDYGRKAFNQKHVADALLRIEQGEPLRRFEINALRRVYGSEFAKTLEKNLVTGSNWDKLANSITIPRTVLSAMDVSYPLRQGIKVSVRHPKEFVTDIGPMLRSFASEGVTEHIDDTLRTDALPIQVTHANGTITSTTWGQVLQDTDMLRPLPDAEAHFLSREEGFLSNIANKFPLVRNSARAFITYGNKLRADIGKYWIQRWIKNGEEITPLRLQALGNVLNRLTGRGTLGNNVVAEAIQTLGWAPKLTVSGPQSALQMFHSDPLIRKIAIENMVSFTAGGVALLSLAKMSGAADVSLQPGADFGKMRIGNLRINIFGSDQVLARTIYQIASGKSVDYLTGTSPVNTKNGILRYLRGRLSPEGSLITDIMAGKNYIGQELGWNPKTFWREAPQRLIPLAIQDIYDTYRRQGALAAVATAPLTLLGLPTSSYETAAQQLANSYNERVGRGDFGPNAKPYKDETPTTRKFNIAQHEDLQELDATRNITSRKELDADKLGLEQEYRLPEAARRILAGENIGPQFVKDFEEYQTKMQGIYFDKYFSFDPRNDSAEEQALQGYRDISPNDPKYRDPATNEVLWDDFFQAKDAALAALSPELKRALKESLKSLDPDVQKVEAQLIQAKELRSDLFDTPQFRGVSIEQEHELRDFYEQVADARRFWFENNQADVPVADAIRAVAARLGKGPNFQRWAMLLRSGSATRDSLRDPAYTQFLVKNEEAIRPFFPELYESRRVLQEVRQ